MYSIFIAIDKPVTTSQVESETGSVLASGFFQSTSFMMVSVLGYTQILRRSSIFDLQRCSIRGETIQKNHISKKTNPLLDVVRT